MSERRLRFDGKTKVCSGNKGEAKGEVGGEEEEEERGKEIYYSLSYLPPPPHITPSSLNPANPLRLAAPRLFKMAAAHVNTQIELSSSHPLKTVTFRLGARIEPHLDKISHR